MDNPLKPPIANILVDFQEKQLFDKVPKPYCYVCCADDIFASFASHIKANRFFQYLNNLHSSLQFTMEGNDKNMWSFFNDLAEKNSLSFVTSVYRKSTFIGLYLS